MELLDKLHKVQAQRPLQRTFSFKTLPLSADDEEEPIMPSTPLNIFGWMPFSAQKSLDDLDSRMLFETLSALLQRKN